MKSEFSDRETIGSQVLKTESQHQNMKPICAGELSEAIGKDVMKRILDVVEAFQGTYPRLYIETVLQRDPIFRNRRFNLQRKVSIILPLMQPNQDVWFVDYENEKFEHLWGLPSRCDFGLILADESPDSEKSKQWIREYLKLEKASLKANKVFKKSKKS